MTNRKTEINRHTDEALKSIVQGRRKRYPDNKTPGPEPSYTLPYPATKHVKRSRKDTPDLQKRLCHTTGKALSHCQRAFSGVQKSPFDEAKKCPTHCEKHNPLTFNDIRKSPKTSVFQNRPACDGE